MRIVLQKHPDASVAITLALLPLLCAQRNQWVNASGTPSRKVSGNRCHARQKGRYGEDAEDPQ